jgi:hypothetical protein
MFLRAFLPALPVSFSRVVVLPTPAAAVWWVRVVGTTTEFPAGCGASCGVGVVSCVLVLELDVVGLCGLACGVHSLPVVLQYSHVVSMKMHFRFSLAQIAHAFIFIEIDVTSLRRSICSAIGWRRASFVV